MARGRLIIGVATLFVTLGLAVTQAQQPVAGQSQTTGQPTEQPPVAAFKAGVDLVRIAAVVRDRKGRFVQDLKARDFEVLDEGHTRAIANLQSDVSPVSVAVLFDVSGSME